MDEQVLRYDKMVEDALRSVVRQALTIAATEGLPGAHHFYLTFETGAPGVEIPSFLVEKYPDQMTIVIQYQYESLLVDDDSFALRLQFSGQPCQLHIPFSALTAFVDPSVKFGLQFKVDGMDNAGQADVESKTSANTSAPADEVEKTAEVVTLDSFRKKQ